jgi:hypothetical protein
MQWFGMSCSRQRGKQEREGDDEHRAKRNSIITVTHILIIMPWPILAPHWLVLNRITVSENSEVGGQLLSVARERMATIAPRTCCLSP